MSKRDQPNNESLLEFVIRLDKEDYYEVNVLCDVVKKHAQRLQEMEASNVTSSYTTICINLADEVRKYIVNKQEYFMPYVRSLFEKAADGHDCRHCTGPTSCNLQHGIQLAELHEGHIQLKDILNCLQVASLPLYSDTIYPDVYRILRNNMALLESNIGQLFLLEETSLVPKVVEAQKNIHAGN